MGTPVVNDQDERTLTLLAIFHYILGGFNLLFSCLVIFYLFVGAAALRSRLAALEEAVPLQALGATFLLILAGAISLGAILSVLIIGTGYFLSRRRFYTFCMVVAGGEAILVIPLGSILGMLTL